MTIDYQALLDIYTSCEVHPTLIVADAESEYGKYILAHRDGEMDFDGFRHAYVERGDQTFLVPLWEWEED